MEEISADEATDEVAEPVNPAEPEEVIASGGLNLRSFGVINDGQ